MLRFFCFTVSCLVNRALNRISSACEQYLGMNKVDKLLSDWHKH